MTDQYICYAATELLQAVFHSGCGIITVLVILACKAICGQLSDHTSTA